MPRLGPCLPMVPQEPPVSARENPEDSSGSWTPRFLPLNTLLLISTISCVLGGKCNLQTLDSFALKPSQSFLRAIWACVYCWGIIAIFEGLFRLSGRKGSHTAPGTLSWKPSALVCPTGLCRAGNEKPRSVSLGAQQTLMPSK